MAFIKGVSGNPAGRKRTLDTDKPTNRSNRQRELMSLVRKLKPLQTKAIQAAVGILDDKEASETGKLRSAALIIQTYKDLLKDLYNPLYDEEEAEEIMQDNKPIFSLHMLPEKVQAV